jgi:hypothetical protein
MLIFIDRTQANAMEHWQVELFTLIFPRHSSIVAFLENTSTCKAWMSRQSEVCGLTWFYTPTRHLQRLTDPDQRKRQNCGT